MQRNALMHCSITLKLNRNVCHVAHSRRCPGLARLAPGSPQLTPQKALQRDNCIQAATTAHAVFSLVFLRMQIAYEFVVMEDQKMEDGSEAMLCATNTGDQKPREEK